MSGGHWGYKNEYQLQDALQDIARDLRTEYPELSTVFYLLADLLPKVTHDIDYDICGDTSIANKKAFDKKWAKKIRAALKLTEKVGEMQNKVNDAQEIIEKLLANITEESAVTIEDDDGNKYLM